MVIPLVEERTDEIVRLCRRHQVQRLWVFGSAASGAWDPKSSDLDFLVRFNPEAQVTYVGEFARLQTGLSELFGRPVDLIIDREFSNPEFRASIEQTRTPLYES